jgi:hypothetical protein
MLHFSYKNEKITRKSKFFFSLLSGSGSKHRTRIHTFVEFGSSPYLDTDPDPQNYCQHYRKS